MYVLVSENSHGGLTEYYSGKTYIHLGERYSSTVNKKDAKTYTSKKRAENAAAAISDKVGYLFIVEEVSS